MIAYVPFSVFSRGVYEAETEEKRLRREVEDLRNTINSLQEKPSQLGVVASVHERDGQRYAVILAAGATIEKRLVSWSKDVRPGMAARLLQEGAQPVAFGMPHTGGIVATVTAAREGLVEFTMQGVDRSATTGVPCKVGDRVMLDQSGAVVVENLGSGTRKAPAAATGVSWDDIGGLEDVKQALRDAIEGPVLHADIYRKFGKKPCKGICLWGPSGTGKTMLGKAAATALAKVHGKSGATTGFIYVKGPDLLNPLIGQGEANVRALFTAARSHHAEHGYPAIIFLDEAESLLGIRGRNPFEGAEKTIVPQFLAEMDGFDHTGAIVILTTNRPEAIDPAFRSGRIDRYIEVPPPSKDAVVDIFRKCLKGRPYAPAELPELATEELFSDRHVLGVVDRGKGRERVTLGAWGPSGAVVAGLVEQATQLAIARAIAGGAEGITPDDVKAAMPELVATTRKRLEGAGALAQPLGGETRRSTGKPALLT